MNRDEIAQMMQDTAGANWGTEAHFQRFAALVAAEKDRQIAFLKDSHDAIRELAYKTGAVEEREACALVCENIENHDETISDTYYSDHYAKAIRARGEA